MNRLLACLMISLSAAASCPAVSRFVATNGSDSSGNGNIGQPFRTLNYTLMQCASGDVVEVRGGLYTETGEVRLRGPGITIRSYSNEWAVIQAPVTNEDDFTTCFYLDPEADDTVLSRLEIIGGYYYGIMLQTQWDWGEPDTTGACRVLIENCIIHDTGRDAIKITPQCDDVTIRNCEVYHSGIGPANVSADNAEGLDCVNGDRVLVQDCLFHDIYTAGIYLKGGSRDGIIERTRVERCGGAGIMLGFDTSPEYFSTNTNPRYYENINGTIRNCLITDTGWEGIGLYAASNAAVFNNTLVNVCTNGIHAALYFGLTYQDWEPAAGRPPSIHPLLHNNLVAQPEGFSNEMFEIRYSDDLGGMSALEGWPDMDYNGYLVSGGTALFTDNRPHSFLDQGTLSDWRTHAGTDAHSQSSEPLFADANASNYRLSASSPYLESGTNAAWMSGATDLAGLDRILGTTVEVGAYEYTGSPSAPSDHIIDHADIPIGTNLPAAVIAGLTDLRWFFTHASVGGNIITGMGDLHTNDPSRYPLAIYNYDGQSGDGDYHGAVPTAGSEGGADYRAAPLAATSNGVIYECMRGNPDWPNKITCFSNSLALSGWRFPKVNVVMEKFCWIDPYADPNTYCTALNNLELCYPQTLVVYTTMPLTTETAGSENDYRNDFNRAVRVYCRANGKWLLDVADMEAWTSAGLPHTYVSGQTTNQMMVSTYAVNSAGGNFHLNTSGRRQVARGWYALAGALFTTDRDGDGLSDGDELIAGTCPTNATDVLTASLASEALTSRHVMQWAMVTNRVYSIEQTTTLSPPNWSNLITGLTGVGWHSITVTPSSVHAAYQRITATQ